MNQHYMYIIRMEDMKVTTSFLKKMTEAGGPGRVIPLTPDEFEIASTMIVVPVGAAAEQQVITCEHGKAPTETCIECGRMIGEN